MRFASSTKIAVVSALFAVPVAFAQPDMGGSAKPGTTAPSNPGGTAPAPMSDAQIAAVVVAANQVDIDAGKLAGSRTKNTEVKKFAKDMVTDHTSVNKEATALVKKLKVKPEENDTSRALKTAGKENIIKLKALKGAEFDRAYVENEVAYHQQVIDAVDKTLIPNAQNADLKAMLEKVRPTLAQHLEHAKSLQGSMGTGGSGMDPHHTQH